MRLEALDTVMEAAYEESAPEFLGLIEMFSSARSDQGLRELLLTIYDFVQSQPEPCWRRRYRPMPMLLHWPKAPGW